MKIFVACSSSNDIPEKYIEDCKKYLSILLKENDLVFGAYNEGLMKIAYEIALKNKRKIIGVCPKAYKKDIENLILNEKTITENISERTEKLIEKSDACIFLPGGTGTLQELFTALEIKCGKEMNKAIIIYNSNNYYDNILKMLDKIQHEKFINKTLSDYYHISDSIEDTLEYLKKVSI